MDEVRIIPLGGLGEIGLNMMVMESGNEAMIIDCGLMFPEPHMPGIDIVIPDFSYLLNSDKKLAAIVLTHGHEDHIGGLPFFLRHLNAPIYGTSFTLGLVENKLEEHDLMGERKLIEVSAGDVCRAGPFEIKFLRICHSIPDGCALAIDTPAGLIVHSGDFKFDDAPADSKLADYEGLSACGDKGVLALLSDSTNVELKGNTGTEKSLEPNFSALFSEAGKKVFVALFSSNINRVQQIINTAEGSGRKVALIGRSLIRNTIIARERGYLKVKEATLIDVKEIKNYSPDKVAVLTTGSQGEPMSGLSLMTTGNYKQLSIEKGDRVILSSKTIPGNEKLVCNIINHLVRLGAEVFYDRIAHVHVTGHGQEEDLKKMISLVRPRFFIPIHGEARHLAKHIKLAKSMGIEEEKTIFAADGDVITLTGECVKAEGKVPSGRIFVDGKGVGDVKDIVLRDRMHLSKGGIVMALLAIDHASGAVASEPEIFSRGFIDAEEEEQIIGEAKREVSSYLDELAVEAKKEWSEVEAEIGRLLKRFFKKKMSRRPVIIPVVLEM
ncbi:MAG: ribonuclease J [Deltaproteobacteria bacterium]|nr:ribonuclease J [Deltaproteobacteria bacterium]